jgi:hypothetical protein
MAKKQPRARLNRTGKIRKTRSDKKVNTPYIEPIELEVSEYDHLKLSGPPECVGRKVRVLEALEKTFSIVAPACKMANVSRVTYYEWIAEDPVFKNTVDSLRMVKKDLVEYMVVQSALQGDAKCRIELNKKLNRDRGYGDKITLVPGIEPSVANKIIVIPHNGKDKKNIVELPASSVSVQDEPGRVMQKAS